MTNVIVGLDQDERERGIEITPEMIEAGASVLYRMELAFAWEPFWAEEVYRAMASLAPAPHVPAVSTLAPDHGVLS